MTNEKALALLPVFQFDDVQVDPYSIRVLKAGREVALEPKAFDLLIFLLENPGRLLEKGELLDAVWKDTTVTENALTREIAKLRKGLGDQAKAARYIQTVHSRGYRFIAEVGITPGERQNGHYSIREKAETVSNGAALVAPPVTTSDAASEGAKPQLCGNAESEEKEANGKPLRAPLLRVSKRLALGGGLFVICLVAMLVWQFYRATGLPRAPEVVEIAPVTTKPGLALNPTFSPDGGMLAYASDQNGEFELYAKPLAPGGRELQLTADGNWNLEPAWSPDGKLIAYHSDKRGGLWLMPALGGTPRQLTEFGCRPAWSRDGTLLVFQSESFHDLIQPYASSATLWVVAAQGGAPRQLTQTGAPAGGHLCPAWSPDGQRVAFLNANLTSYQIWSVPVAGGAAKQLTPDFSGDKADLVWDNDGQSIYFTMGMSLLKLHVDPATGERSGKPVKVADLGATVFRNPAISADGKKIAYSAWAPRSNIWSVPLAPHNFEASGVPVPLTNETSSRNGLTAFAPDGMRLAFTTERRGIGYQIWLMDADGRNQAPLMAEEALAPSWFSDGKHIAFQRVRQEQQTLSALTLNTRQEKILSQAAANEFPRFSPDGKRVAFTYAPGGFYNVGTRRIGDGGPQQLTFEQRFAGFPCWSPDGQSLAFQVKQGDDMHVWLLPSGGGVPTQLTFGRGENWPYSWSPDGDKITFAGARNGVWNIWWISRSDKTLRQLTRNTKAGVVLRFPDWSPLGNQIVYEQVELVGNINVLYLK